MTLAFVFALVIVALALPGLLRCTLEAAWQQGDVSLRLRLAGLPLRLPGRKKTKNNLGQSRASLEGKEETTDLQRWLDSAGMVIKLLQQLIPKLRVDELRLCFVSSFREPYDTVMAYNAAALGMQAVEEIAGGSIRKLCLENRLDFDRGSPTLDAYVKASVSMGRFVALVLSALYGHQSILRAYRRRQAAKG